MRVQTATFTLATSELARLGERQPQVLLAPTVTENAELGTMTWSQQNEVTLRLDLRADISAAVQYRNYTFICSEGPPDAAATLPALGGAEAAASDRLATPVIAAIVAATLGTTMRSSGVHLPAT